jgi:hypothetical protein
MDKTDSKISTRGNCLVLPNATTALVSRGLEGFNRSEKIIYTRICMQSFTTLINFFEGKTEFVMINPRGGILPIWPSVCMLDGFDIPF